MSYFYVQKFKEDKTWTNATESVGNKVTNK